MLEKDIDKRFNAEQILNEILNIENNFTVNYDLQSLRILQNFYDDLDYVKFNNNNLTINQNLQNEIANNENNLQNFKEDKFKIENESKLIGFSNNFEFIEQINSFKIKEIKKTSFLNYIFGGGEKVEKIETFNWPFDILIDNDLIYIVDSSNKRIVIFNLENNQFVKQFNLNFEPSCIKLDKTNDTLLIGDYWYNVIYRFNKNFELLQQYGNNNGNNSYCISISGIEYKF
ncbi:hypothetical protein ABK040_000436 [Willaertia magna]